MRLIDADKMIQSVDMQITIARKFRSNDSQYQEFVSITEQSIKQEISNAPTVKAIPIEFIEAFKKEFRAVASVKAVIEWLLEKWEKENEHKESD